MRFGSVCSGIEAASVAWHPLGWESAWLSEIEPFPCAVLKHHYPTVPNLGDMTKFKEWQIESNIDVLVGGTPCQSFSVAGLRKGLDDPRGNLMLTYLAIAKQHRPRWLVWENVPAFCPPLMDGTLVASSEGWQSAGMGSHTGCLTLNTSECHKDADVCLLSDVLETGRSAAEVLFERESLPWNIEKSISKKQRTSSTIKTSVGERSQARSPDGNDTIGTLLARDYKGIGNQDLKDGRGLILEPIVYETHPADSRVKEMGDTCQTVTSRWGTGGGNVPLVHSVAVDVYNQSIDGDVCATLTRAVGGSNTSGAKIMQAYSIREDAKANTFNATLLKVTPALQALRPSVQSHHAQTFIAQPMAVRRLTPIECERLQGFPDNYTDIRLKDKYTPDSPRYKAIGNSMAVPCMRWIGKRIQEVNRKI